MPFGGLMASEVFASSQNKISAYINPLTRQKTNFLDGGISLIDGQQRTLSMLLAWPGVYPLMNRRIWVDLGEGVKSGHLLRLHITSESQPFGYQRGGNSGEPISRLTLSERRLAYSAYPIADKNTEDAASQKLPFLQQDEIVPWQSTLAIDLRQLIENWQSEQSLSRFVKDQRAAIAAKLCEKIKLIEAKSEPFKSYDETLRGGILKHLKRRLNTINSIPKSEFDKRINTLEKGLAKLFQQYFPVIEVPAEVIDEESATENVDPPLAILFKRIGTGGTNLSTADYVFSVIKHLNPECHTLVNDQLNKPYIAAIFSPTALVLSALRLTAANLAYPDHAHLDKLQFNRLLRGKSEENQNPTKTIPFLLEFNQQITHAGNFVLNINLLLDEIAYQKNSSQSLLGDSLDIGFPKQALTLVQISAIEVILFWLQKQLERAKTMMKNNRHQIVRFILCWHLLVLEPAKASIECIKKLKCDQVSELFPEKPLFEHLVAQGLALPFFSPQQLQDQQVQIKVDEKDAFLDVALTHSPATVNGLRGWRRFVATPCVDEAERKSRQQAVSLYQRWWSMRPGYSHALLLWLQRDYVSRCFESLPAFPGLEEEKPYDFDHICPQSHWNYWTGKTHGNRLIDFHAEKFNGGDSEGHWRLGNAIGNVRVWHSSDNRSDGDSLPSLKLRLTENCDIESQQRCLSDSAIANKRTNLLTDERIAWAQCDPPNGKDAMYWTIERALSFQSAVELRTFNLYQRFYTDLRVGELSQQLS